MYLVYLIHRALPRMAQRVHAYLEARDDRAYARERAAREAYLAEAVDMCDLEARERKLDRMVFGRFC